MLYNKGTTIPTYIYGIICELATMGYIDKNQTLNADFLNKAHIEELIDLDEIGKEVKRRLGGLKMDLDEMELKATKNREKTGDEMFKELGYEDSPCGYGAKRYKGRNYYITFYKNQIRIVPREVDDDIILNFKELQAINKKCEELGWK